MAEYPLLPLPSPRLQPLPPGRGFPPTLPRLPGRQRQGERIGPKFRRLQEIFDLGRDPVTLRADPTGLAPERVLVFELAGSVGDFEAACKWIRGLEYLTEQEVEFEPDDDFWVVDTRVRTKGQRRLDKPVGGRIYTAMPDVTALRHLLSLWKRYQDGLEPEDNFGQWFKVFDQLRDLRPWGPEDRIPDDLVTDFQQALAEDGGALISTEVELWASSSASRCRSSQRELARLVRRLGGSVIQAASIPEIAYEAALVELPRDEIARLVRRDLANLAICDDIMFVRPQSHPSYDRLDRDLTVGAAPDGPTPSPHQRPIAALLDGVPIQRHRLLDGRVVVDDPDGLEDLTLASRRWHGTAMASLILHGDRHLQEAPLDRLLHIHPVLYAPDNLSTERFQQDRLLIDTIYRAVLRMKEGSDGTAPTAPDAFLVNLSLGDKRRPYAGQISPWARLLDYLAHRYNILFLVSAGNVNDPLPVPGYNAVTDFEEASAEDRETAVMVGLGEQRSQRTLLSPAEALNVLTVGACHDEACESSPSAGVSIDPYVSSSLPNITSAMGLGHRKAIKPEILLPGGRERVLPLPQGDQLLIRSAQVGSSFGIRVAVPDPQGRTNREGHQSGTSVATALATRSAHRLFDALMDPENGAILADVDPMYYSVVVKALLVHRASWDEDVASRLRDLYPGHYVARDDNVARVIGYGVPRVDEAMTCTSERATLIGYGRIENKQIATCRLPLPASLERVEEPRALTVTLAWFSPVNVRHLAYRRTKLEVKGNFERELGTARTKLQPSDKSIPRGTLFHQRYEGDQAIAFVGDGELALQVVCKEQAGRLDEAVRYGLAVTIEAGDGIPVYQEIRDRLAIRPPV